MSVRTKFKVQSIQRFGQGHTTDPQGNPHTYHQTNVAMVPVYVSSDQRKGGNTENEMFGFYTPNGSISLMIQNDAAADQFAVDQEFYVDFTPAS